MMTHYFVRPSAIARLYEGPLGPYMDSYARLLHEQQYSKMRVQRKLRLAAILSRWLDSERLPLRNLTKEKIEDFIQDRKRQNLLYLGDTLTFRDIFAHLCRHGAIRQPFPKRPRTRLDIVKEQFAEYLFQERGLHALTVRRHLRFVHSFLSGLFPTGRMRFGEIFPCHITRYVSRHAYDGTPSAAKWMTTMLRSFLRFLWLRERTSVDLSACVPSVAWWRLAGLPKFLEPEQVERVLACCDRRKPVGQRDYAILLLLARLGLRGNEIVTLTLDDINWEAGEIMIRGKGSREDRLPLPQDVGDAIVAYLRKGRPACSSRHVFVRARAPYRKLARSASVSTIVRYAIGRSGIKSFHCGAHLFRHSLARRMLKKGTSLADIGEILRHQHQDTTAIYAKVDLPSLKGLAKPWPGGV